jgi:hypothetical protein
LIGVTGAEKNAVGRTIDFYHPLFTATLGADRGVFGGTESLSLSLSTQNTFHSSDSGILVYEFSSNGSCDII